MKSEKSLSLQTELFQSKSGSNKIFDAVYHGEACYALVHTSTDCKVLFDHDEKVLESVKRKIRTDGGFSCYQNKDGHKHFKIAHARRGGSVQLRAFLFSRYQKLSLDKVHGKRIMLHDRTAETKDIYDFRSANLYEAGISIQTSKLVSVKMIERPGAPEEKYISVSCSTDHGEATELLSYEPELFQILSSPSRCNISFNAISNRLMVWIISGADRKPRTINLARFAMIYKEHFDKYRKRRGAITRFLKDYLKLAELHQDMEVGHVNACKQNGTWENLIWMARSTNHKMRDYARYFTGRHAAFTAVKDGAILIEYAGKYFRCNTPEDYLSWQNTYLGRDQMTQNLKISSNWHQIPTLADGVKDKTVSKGELQFLEWLEHRDELLLLPDEAFIIHDPERVHTLEGVLELATTLYAAAMHPFSVSD